MLKALKKRTRIPVDGCEESMQLYSRPHVNLLGVTHEISYRNRFGERLLIKISSSLSREDSNYTGTGPKDHISPDGKTWTHAGASRMDSRKFVNIAATVTTSGEFVGEACVRYTIGNEAPDSDILSGEHIVALD